MSSDESHIGGGRVRSITPDLDNELNSWLEVANGFGSGQTILVACVRRMRAAGSRAERDSVRDEVRGYCRRLALGMLRLLDLPLDASADLTVTKED